MVDQYSVYHLVWYSAVQLTNKMKGSKMKRISWFLCLIVSLFFMLPVYANPAKETAVAAVKDVAQTVGDVAVEKSKNISSNASEVVGSTAAAVERIVDKLPKVTRDECSGWGAQAGLMMKGFADAVSGAANSTVDEVLKASDTKVGKICTFVLVYKFIGHDLIATGRGMIGSICGIFLLIVFLVLVHRFYKAFFYPIRVLTKTEGKNKVYEYKPSLAERIDQAEAGLSWLVAFVSAAVFFGIGCAICHMI